MNQDARVLDAAEVDAVSGACPGPCFPNPFGDWWPPYKIPDDLSY